jgi:hypothetical protein
MGAAGKRAPFRWRGAAAIRTEMPDRFALPLLALVAIGLIGLALVWPQGQGALSPAPFGHPLAQLAASPAPPAREALRGPEHVAGARP